ncbi:unnamed protein product (macronuclear) [Paramecium tetraurelia]|uniref:Uncharacterized protein n=1 Tax=Paramecium tetraurelia TaxID=5888 RepID=A0D282_PARTE|nr:uncharacterized protein GSPATT00012655001 [Paramecium tetraurelia]CAK77149.1 unnamed protein product [Paramecium tetraurelia]|eukprot:XP_001444546.1 hypothetical protein (macronuclear) [Paramecium tetraurelia strain d4-2]
MENNLDQTASFFHNPKLKIPKLKCTYEVICSPDLEIPTFSRKDDSYQQKSLFKQCQRRNSQNNLTHNNLQNIFHQISLKKANSDSKPNPKVPPLKIQQKTLLSKVSDQKSTSQHSTTILRGRGSIKILQNPFITDSRHSQKSTCTSGSQPPQPKGKPFLQRKAQIQMVNRVFSSMSQHK